MFYCEGDHWNRLPERLQILKIQIVLVDLSLSKGLGQDDLQRSLPTSAIL